MELLERQLKDAIQRDHDELLELLHGPVEKAWKDGVYRFYHQSYKVFRLQKITGEIVTGLQGLLPEQTMNTWFLEIVDAGTTLKFGSETNTTWTQTTRPIVEAFCHGKYFLDMACKEHDELVTVLSSAECDMKRRIRMVSSGWSALLALFNIH